RGSWFSRFSRHCVAAFCGLRPQAMQGEVSPCEPLWPAFQLLLASLALRASLRLLLPLVVASFTKANNAYAAKGHPCPWPLVWSHPNDAIGFGKLRAGTNGPGKPQQPESFWAACGRKNFRFSVFGFCVRSTPKKAFPA